MIDKIRCEKRIGNDIHNELIAMFKEIQNGWQIPLHISEDEYNAVRDNKTLFSWLFPKHIFQSSKNMFNSRLIPCVTH